MARIQKTDYTTPKTILSAPELAYTLPVKVANTNVTEDENGRKVIKAGTPIKGDLEKRETAFTKETEDATGILLHEVDVTDGDNNGTIVVSGAIDVSKVDTTTAALYTATIKEKLNKIIFMKGV